MNPLLPRQVSAIAAQFTGEAGGPKRADEDLSAEQLTFRIVERDQRDRWLGRATMAGTAATVFGLLVRFLGRQ